MRLYGTLQELTSLVIRLASGKTVKIQADEQTAAGETVINIPNAVDGVDTVVLVDTQQTLTQKTLTAPTVTSLTLSSSVIIQLPAAAPAAGQNAFGRVYVVSETEGPRLRIGSSTTDNAFAQVVTTLSSDQFQNKTINAISNTLTEIDPAASFRIIEANADKVVKYNSAGIPLVSKIVDTNIDAAAAISGSKLADGTVGAAKLSTLSSADLAGKVTDETGSGSLVFATSPTLTTPSIAQINTPAQSLAISGTGALTLPAGNNSAQRPGTPANGMIRYNSTDNTFEGYSNGAWAGIGGGGTTDKVTQASHGFVLGDVLYLNGSTYAKAIASAANTAEVVGVVSRVIDASTFEMTLSGEISGLSGLTPGEVYFLSAATAGLLTIVEPSVVGQVSLPVGVASSASTLYVAPKRGVVVGAANARTTISIANNTASNVVSVVDYNSLKLEGELNVTRSSGGNQRAYYTVEAAKNGAGVWQVSASYTGDDVLYTTLPSWDVASNNLQVTMPLVTNFSSASLTYALNAPAVGASLPLSIDSSALNIVADAPLSYRNRIINGDMRIDQRNSGAAVTATVTAAATYTLDRWAYWAAQASKFTVQQNAGSVTPPVGFTKYLGVTSSSAYSVGASDYFFIQQPVEGFNFADLSWGTADAKSVTLSFWVRSSLTGSFGGFIRNGAANRSYPFSYSISSANTWTNVSVTIAGDTTGTWTADNSASALIGFSLGAGSSFSGTANTWAGANYVQPTGATSVVGTNGATLYLTGVQLEVGSKASAFERRPYGMELELCERYYQTISGFQCNTGLSTTECGASLMYKTEMRGSPTVSLSAPLSVTRVGVADFTQSAANVSISLGGVRINSVGATLQFSNFTGLTADTALGHIVTSGRVLLAAEL